MSLETIHLTLVPCAPAHLLALIDDLPRFETVSGLRAADGLGAFYRSEHVRPEWLAALRKAEAPDPWRHGFFVIHRESGAVIGAGGFTGPPDASATVEIGYGIVPSFEGQGYATEVAAALVEFAFTSEQVHVVRAHTLPEANPSTRVLVKCGFRHIGTIVDPVDGPVWRWERTRVRSAPAGGAQMADFQLPTDLMHNRGLIQDPTAYARKVGCRSWLYLVGDEFATMPGGMSYAQVQEAVQHSARVVSDPPRVMDLDLARQHIAALDELPRPTLVSCRTGPRASAVAYLYAGLKRGATYDEVLEAAERDNAPFVSSPEIKEWVRTSLEALG